MRAALWVVIAGVAAAGCSTLADAYERNPAFEVKGVAWSLDGSSIEESFAKEGQARFPARLAVAGVESNRFGRYDDPSLSVPVAALAGDAAHWSEVMPLPGFLAGGNRSWDELRRAAARLQADALLLYDQSVTLEKDTNILAILNLLIVPGLIVPTVPYEAEVRTTAALVDVRNGFVYATAHDERRGNGVSPQMLVAGNARDLKRRLGGEAFETIRETLRERLERHSSRP